MINTPITACVITLNAEHSIGACIDSLRICEEIIVVDAHSTDRTREIARQRGARVVERACRGIRTQQQFAASLARNDWIMSIDADERLSSELSREIVRVRQYGLDEFAGYQIPFLATCAGRAMSRGDWRPDFHLRLFNRRRTSFGDEEVHARVIAYGPVGRLRGNILHDSYRDPAHQPERDQRSRALRVFLHPAWRFLRAAWIAERAPGARPGGKARTK